MNVLINEGLSTLGKLTGIGVHSYNLYKHLKKMINCKISNYNYLKYFPRIARRTLYISIVNIEVFFKKYDIIHYQNYYVPRNNTGTRQLTTIHDLTCFKYPDSLPGSYLPYITKAITQSINNVTAIITPSESTKQDVLNQYRGIKDENIFVCWNGVRDIFFNNLSIDKNYLYSHNLFENEYFLYVGTIEHRKNLEFLIENFIYAQLNNLISNSRKLVLAGKMGYNSEKITRYLEYKNIIWLNHVNDVQLVSLYHFARALVMPSLYEGFGIPIAEAIVTNTPVIASNIPSSLEFNRRHNNNINLFKLNDRNSLVQLLEFADKHNLREKLDYGDTTIYSYDNVANNHLNIYKKIL